MWIGLGFSGAALGLLFLSFTMGRVYGAIEITAICFGK